MAVNPEEPAINVERDYVCRNVESDGRPCASHRVGYIIRQFCGDCSGAVAFPGLTSRLFVMRSPAAYLQRHLKLFCYGQNS
ncbi:hypothetical protein ACPOL_5285 [Acidisarcina polymorpha]|uniref:Uncharacterized protein n=1 Tax=Acidisarcina polymorpha TaxID=2211140 RepID=A0A2Z5G6W3_9BACT|nr:hypothetical protein ACPOL_5285 [Acidisarcina polymorpha]